MTFKQEPDNGMDAEASAIEMAQALDLDAAVRTVAKSGRNHDNGPNWYAEWEGMQISATFGAGTNSAYCQTLLGNETTVLYGASKYGRHIEVFRNGPWVDRLLAYAQVLRRANSIKEKEEEREARLDNFKEIDF